MMHWISTWLREIILVVLLATFVDLLLPNSSMQRYVKVVVSLFILMTILSPLILLLKTDFDFNQMALKFEEVNGGGQLQTSAEMPSMQKVLREGEALQAEQVAQTKQMVEKRIAEHMREQIEVEGGVSLKQIAVTTAIHKDEGYYIDQVEVILNPFHKALPAASGLQQNHSQNVDPIAPIDIKVELSDQEQLEASSEKQPDSEWKEQADNVQALLGSRWGLKDSQIAIKFETADSS